MDSKERNRIMESLLDECLNPGIPEEITAQEYAAIRECDRLARAWNALREKMMLQEVATTHTGFHWAVVMESILNPTPQDPLEVLEDDVEQLHTHADKMFSTTPARDTDYYRGVLGTSSRILAKIRELKVKK